jgi:hypothetical protein
MFGILVFWPGREVWYLVFWYFGSAVGAGVWCFVTWRTPPKTPPRAEKRLQPALQPSRLQVGATLAGVDPPTRARKPPSW